jgi:hypothetical protein
MLVAGDEVEMSIAQSWPALIISILALVFTIFSFWWMNWRRGKLIVGPPRSYAMAAQKEGLLLVRIPLVFYNDGAATQVVQNLRLTLEQNDIKSEAMKFTATVSDLLGGDFKDGTRQFASQFAVEGRKSHSGYFEFQLRSSTFVPSQGKCKATLEAKLDDSMNWKTLLVFELNISGTNWSSLLPYDNDPN